MKNLTLGIALVLTSKGDLGATGRAASGRTGQRRPHLARVWLHPLLCRDPRNRRLTRRTCVDGSNVWRPVPLGRSSRPG